ncbi:DUF3570 domain-containing protein [Carboxylicivirga linearis]|uniref:DUF3570 domain-containing protein n=1 Tax=Carboxylicivirga linearis TaxID=1628157 RepID=A0ABS5JU17_9BACT|nr:DUF3570 domain-containing protein [Carboxylicivirga linearis]MBS2098399.1 DUF3570 domain-containing protein [Carboxylicivirga linearis]
MKRISRYQIFCSVVGVLAFTGARAQNRKEERNDGEYKKRVLERTEVDFLTSIYNQDGENAAVSGGKGTEQLTDGAAAIVVSVPLNDDDVLTIDASVSAYTSASSSNINPFDGEQPADPFRASSGASKSDVWSNFTGTYSHSSDDRNSIWSSHFSVSSEFDYFSLGFGGGYTRLLNEKNTELHAKLSVHLDSWSLLYPYELRPFGEGGEGLDDPFFSLHNITGNPDYAPVFSEHSSKKRNSYALGLSVSQIFTSNFQGIFLFDLIQQNGLLSTPFQRVYFADTEASFIDQFQLADDVEQLPDARLKIALGTRLHYYLNEIVVARAFYRYYFDEWGVLSHTANVELPVKISQRFTLYPSYRYYYQSAADYFKPFEQHLSTDQYYTSDYDLSEFTANQLGFGISYSDIFTESHIWRLGIKSIDLKYNYYERNSGFHANLISAGIKLVVD